MSNLLTLHFKLSLAKITGYWKKKVNKQANIVNWSYFDAFWKKPGVGVPIAAKTKLKKNVMVMIKVQPSIIITYFKYFPTLCIFFIFRKPNLLTFFANRNKAANGHVTTLL